MVTYFDGRVKRLLNLRKVFSLTYNKLRYNIKEKKEREHIKNEKNTA